MICQQIIRRVMEILVRLRNPLTEVTISSCTRVHVSMYVLGVLRKHETSFARLSAELDVASVTSETKRLLENGGLDTVKAVYFPRFKETDIVLYPEVQSRNHMPEAWPEGGSHDSVPEAVQEHVTQVVGDHSQHVVMVTEPGAHERQPDVQFTSQSSPDSQMIVRENHQMRSAGRVTTSQSTMISRVQSLQHSMERLGMLNMSLIGSHH